MHRSTIIRAALLALLALLPTACGVGAVQETTFAYGSMGVEGGTVEAGDITLVIPPDALAQPTTVAVLPEENPLRIAPPARDPCLYTLLGPQWCCGPIGLQLQRDARLVVEYDEALVPPTATEDDLILLNWDVAQKALVPNAAAVQDTQANTFTVDPYRTLGHVAVGIQSCPPLGIVIAGLNPNPPPLTAQTEEYFPTGMYLIAEDPQQPVVHLPTNDSFTQSFLPSPQGLDVLFVILTLDAVTQLPTQTIDTVLYTVSVEGTPPVLLAGDDELIQPRDPTFGWLRNEATVFFQETLLGNDTPDTARLSQVPHDASTPPDLLYDLGAFAFATDVRQAPDGALLLVRYFGSDESERIDVFERATGTAVSQGLVPIGGGQATPRFLPDGSGIYLVDDDRTAVLRYGVDGSGPVTLFTLGDGEGTLKDFVLAPNGDDYACVVLQTSDTTQSLVDKLFVGALSSGPRGNRELGRPTSYDEVYVHPEGAFVFLDTPLLPVRMFSMADAAAGPDLVADTIALLDVNEETGRLLMTAPPARPFLRDDASSGLPAQTTPLGVYVAEPDGTGLTLVATPPGLQVEQARWQRTVRRAPGMPFNNRIR